MLSRRMAKTAKGISTVHDEAAEGVKSDPAPANESRRAITAASLVKCNQDVIVSPVLEGFESATNQNHGQMLSKDIEYFSYSVLRWYLEKNVSFSEKDSHFCLRNDLGKTSNTCLECEDLCHRSQNFLVFTSSPSAFSLPLLMLCQRRTVFPFHSHLSQNLSRAPVRC